MPTQVGNRNLIKLTRICQDTLYLGMITETGEGLNVLITTDPEKDWQTFSTWYSFWKNLPDANITIAVRRNGRCPLRSLQWTKRLKVRTVWHPSFDISADDGEINRLDAVAKCGIEHSLLVVKPLVVSLSPPQELDSRDLWIDEDAWWMSSPQKQSSALMDKLLLEGESLAREENALCHSAKDTNEPQWLVTYTKGCGRWIDTSTGCPFSNASGLVSATMTVNERKIIEMWRKMVPLYQAVA